MESLAYVLSLLLAARNPSDPTRREGIFVHSAAWLIRSVEKVEWLWVGDLHVNQRYCVCNHTAYYQVARKPLSKIAARAMIVIVALRTLTRGT